MLQKERGALSLEGATVMALIMGIAIASLTSTGHETTKSFNKAKAVLTRTAGAQIGPPPPPDPPKKTKR